MTKRKVDTTEKVKPMASKPLTPKQARFVAEFLIDCNATQAAIRAGYSSKTAASVGQENLRKPEIAARIAEHEARLRKENSMSGDRTLRELACLVFSDIRKVFHLDGRVKMIHEVDADTAAAIAFYEVTVVDGRQRVKIKLWDKNAALEKAMKHLGLFKMDNEQGGNAAVAMFAELHALVSANPLSRMQSVVNPPEQHFHQ